MKSLEEKIEAIKKQADRQKKASRIIRILIIILLGLSTVACILGLPILSLYVGPGLFNDTPDYFVFIFLFIAYGVFYVIPFLLCLPIILPLAMRNKNSNRIVVFRKFNDTKSKKTLAKFISGVVGNYGHVFTLSDKNFKIKWYVRLPFVLGQMTFFHFRPRIIKTQKDLLSLEKKLQNKGWLNVNWYLSWSKIFAVKTIDELWQDTAKLLLREADLVIFDVSVFTSSLEWETRITKELNLENKIIVVANNASKEPAIEWKKTYDNLDDDYDIPLHFYNEKGRLPVVKKFETDIAKVLSLNSVSHTGYVSRILKGTLVTTGSVAAIFLAGLFFLGPFIVPELAGRYSPMKNQVFQSYLQLKMKTASEEEEAPVISRIRNKWYHEAASFSTTYAFKHDKEECRAVGDALLDFYDMSQWSAYTDLVVTGEPAMSETAFTIIRQLFPNKKDANARDFAFKLLSSNRVDVKSKGLALLEAELPDSKLTESLLKAIGDKNYKIDSMPYQHRTAGFLKLSRTPDYNINKFYYTLYRYLDDKKAFIGNEDLKSVVANTPNPDVRYIFSLLLLKRHNAAYLNNILNDYAITRWHRLPIKEPGKLYLFKRVPEPFGEATDSMMLDQAAFTNLPPYAAILQNKEKWTGSYPLPGSMIEFLIRHYSIQALHDTKEFTNVSILSQVLYKFAYEGSAAERAQCLQEVKERMGEMVKLLDDSTMELESKFNVAWLLASTGEMNFLNFLINGSMVGSFLDGNVNARRAAEVLDIIIEQANRSNALPVPAIPDNVPNRVKQRLERLKQIWHG